MPTYFSPLLLFTLLTTTTFAQLNLSTPIHLGQILSPPTMTFLAWLPSQDESYCYSATDSSKLFSLEGIDALQVHDYFSVGGAAWISREGKRWAECKVTPECVRMGVCRGTGDQDCDTGHKYSGIAERRWSCWIIPDTEASDSELEETIAAPSSKIGEMASPTVEFLTTTTVSAGVHVELEEEKKGRSNEPALSERLGLFTPGVTGR